MMPMPMPMAVHEVIAGVARRQPEAPALRAWRADGTRVEWSYGALRVRWQALAAGLRAVEAAPASAGAEPRIALALERSPELVAAMLAALEAGWVFLPLDPDLPRQRLAFLLEDAGARMVLTREGLRSRLPAGAAAVLTLEGLAAAAAAAAADAEGEGEFRPPPIHLDSLAYLLHTSGSTGRPKGVLVTHGGLANLTASRRLGAGPGDVVLQGASPHFDASIYEIFSTLRGGATLEMGTVGPPPVGEALYRTLAEGQVTRAVLTPSVVATLPEEAPATLTALHTLIVAGEACPAALPRRWSAGGRQVLNAYGPTEATVCATVAHCAPEGGAPPLGRAIHGVRVAVLDAALEPVTGEGTGELVIGGAGLARGYLGRPGLTAERFIPDPLAEEPGGRLYRSGDRVRRREDGELEFLGRIDHQLKVHGCRVEPGEIEGVLAESPAVAEAAVVARQGRLVACVVPRDGAPTAATLRGFLARRLPSYMLPSSFHILERLPLTPSGKVDRALLVTDSALAGGQATAPPGGFQAPRTPLEEQLAALWQEILECGPVGRGDDFFSLGAHSLHGTQLVTRLRERLGVEIPLRQLFQHSSLAALAEVVEASASVAASGNEGDAPRVLPREGPLPLSRLQQQLWFVDQLHPTRQGGTGGGDVAYNMSVAVRFHDAVLDRAALWRALDALVERHEVLRTRFVLEEGEPRQVIDPPRAVETIVVDGAGIEGHRWRTEALNQAEGLLRRPFDLRRDGMLRAALLTGRAGPARSAEPVLLLILHHIAADGWSIGVLLAELSQLYRAFRDRPAETPSLAPLPLQYVDLALWQDRRLEGARRQALLDYWRRQLAGAPQTLELPTDRPRKGGRKGMPAGGHREFAMTRQQREGLLEAARGGEATLFMALLAVWGVLLFRHTYQRDLLFSVPVANRLHPASEGLVGFFTNMLVIRLSMADGVGEARSFGDLLAAAREVCLDAFAHQELPFGELVEALRPDRQGGGLPFVQTGFALQNAFRTDRAFPELEIVPLSIHTGASRFDWSLSMVEDEAGLTGSFEYRSDLFDATTLQRLGVHFSALTDALLAEPSTPVDRVAFLPPATRHQLLHEWGWNERRFELQATVQDQVLRQMARTPDAEAVRFGEQHLSYRRLETASGALAGRLRRLGVERGTPVGLFLDRSLELPVAFLAVLRAGGVCVPLDPDHPEERLGFLLADTGAPVVVTQASLRHRLPVEWKGTVLEIGEADAGVTAVAGAPEESSPAVPRVGPEDLAYIVYTSGSTGQPKGVWMHHRGLVNRLLWQQDAYPLGPEDRVLQNLSIGFDAAIWQLFGPWLVGAAVVLPRPGGHMDTAYLARFLEREGITAADFVPSILTPLLEEPLFVAAAERGTLRLRQIVSGGEALHRALARRIFTLLPAVRLLNIYGPTETSLTISATRCDPQDTETTVTVGRPVASTGAYVLDRHGAPAPPGVAGEVYAGGVSITTGYRNRPRLTAQRFVPDPFTGIPGGRLYRTGDLARQRGDGQLEFLGRLDHQVKIRGVRIELGEIEDRLQRLEGVVDGVVLARDDVPGAAPGEKRLVAYVVTEGAAPSPATLRAGLGAALPPAMVPGIFLFLPALPVTVNGKVDRKALPGPEAFDTGSRSLVAPRDRLEMEMVALWGRVLGVEEISVTDHFFDLGGHSLLAVKLLAAIREQMGAALELAELYTAGTVEAMAGRLREEGQTAGATSGWVTLRHGAPEVPPLVCVHGVDGTVHGFAHLARALPGGGAVYGLPVPGLETGGAEPALLEDWQALAAHHAATVAAALPEGPFVLCGWSLGGLLASAVAGQLEAMGRAPAQVVLLDTHPARPEMEVEGPPVAARRAFFLRSLLGEEAPAGEEAEAAFLERVWRVALQEGRLPEGTRRAVLEVRWRVFQALVEGSLAHRPPRHHCSVLLVQAADVPAPWQERQREACRALTQGSFHQCTVAAGHHDLLLPGNVAAVAEAMGQGLAGIAPPVGQGSTVAAP